MNYAATGFPSCLVSLSFLTFTSFIFIFEFIRFKLFFFFSVYSPDMPKRLPIKDIISGLLCSLGTAVRFWLHYTLVAVAWLGIVPLTACKYYKKIYKMFSE